uniref:Uncharacterized protein n=1 Tax=Siphoviridae sp. ctvxh7 TaxID=2827283 RepID=A0A8S5RA10_9CAUD|nr:MAG TPA: hypothetical protein [Siphoviridae sp. ctvxh7]
MGKAVPLPADRRRECCRGSGLIGIGVLSFIMYRVKKCSFSDGCKRQ